MNRPKLFRLQEWLCIGFFVLVAVQLVRGSGMLGALFDLIWVPLCLAMTAVLYFTRRKKLQQWDRQNDPRNFPAPSPPPVTPRIPMNRDDDYDPRANAAAAAASAHSAQPDLDAAERARRMREGED